MRWSLEDAGRRSSPQAGRTPGPRRQEAGGDATRYRRENGRFGIRNHVIILPVDDISNAAAEGVSYLIKGTMALPHPYGRLQFGEDLELTFRTLAGIGRNPNVAAVVVIAIEPKWAQRIADSIAETGKPVAAFSIERQGDLKTIEQAAQGQGVRPVGQRAAARAVLGEDLWMSTKCGESGHHLRAGSQPDRRPRFERLAESGAPSSSARPPR